MTIRDAQRSVIAKRNSHLPDMCFQIRRKGATQGSETENQNRLTISSTQVSQYLMSPQDHDNTVADIRGCLKILLPLFTMRCSYLEIYSRSSGGVRFMGRWSLQYRSHRISWRGNSLNVPPNLAGLNSIAMPKAFMKGQSVGRIKQICTTSQDTNILTVRVF